MKPVLASVDALARTAAASVGAEKCASKAVTKVRVSKYRNRLALRFDSILGACAKIKVLRS
jgi:hypothetical protein